MNSKVISRNLISINNFLRFIYEIIKLFINSFLRFIHGIIKLFVNSSLYFCMD